MSIEEIIIDKMKKLPAEKRERVLRFVESIADAEDGESSELILTAEDQHSLWTQWVEVGPQGPIEDEEMPEFP
jgi:hypothetical protein